MSPKRLVDLTERRFGLLRVSHRVPNKGDTKWFCICDCGESRIVVSALLTRDHTTHCGCKHPRNICGGVVNAPEYKLWIQMRQRCYNPKTPAYEHYGGKGIKVASEWKDFQTFYTDMGPRPNPKMSLDRIDGGKDYCKDNCRWADSFTQNSNTSRNRRNTFNGETLTLSEWSRKVGIPVATINSRLQRGWSVEKTLTTPLNTKFSARHNYRREDQ